MADDVATSVSKNSRWGLKTALSQSRREREVFERGGCRCTVKYCVPLRGLVPRAQCGHLNVIIKSYFT